MRKITYFLFNLFILSAISSYSFASEPVAYRATVVIDGKVEIVVEVTDVTTACNEFHYHYGVKFNTTSREFSDQPYNINFQLFFYSSLGIGDYNYGGTYNVSKGSSSIDASTNNNDKKIDSNIR